MLGGSAGQFRSGPLARARRGMAKHLALARHRQPRSWRTPFRDYAVGTCPQTARSGWGVCVASLRDCISQPAIVSVRLLRRTLFVPLPLVT